MGKWIKWKKVGEAWIGRGEERGNELESSGLICVKERVWIGEKERAKIRG